MKDEYRSMPAIISLTAGFIVSLVLFFKNMQLTSYLLIVLLVLVVFFIIGHVIRFIMVKLLDKLKSEEVKDELKVEAVETSTNTNDANQSES